MTVFWQGRRVFLTGHTGFKGAWLNLWLTALGAEVTGFSLAPHTRPNLFTLLPASGRSHLGDIRDAGHLASTLRDADPQVVIHMAAQALVRESYHDPLGTYATNVLGTANLLDACRGRPSVQAVLIVTSDKVYENSGSGRPFTEDDKLGGHDPYSNSKACAELVAASYRDSYFKGAAPIATARAGNVIGGGDWSADRLIPDCVRALEARSTVRLRYPEATRPWQHVLEPLSGYLTLLRGLIEMPVRMPHAMNFGPDPASFCSVREVVEAFSERFGGKPGWQHDPGSHPPEARALTLSSQLAGSTLGWRSRLDVKRSLAWTADWYRALERGEDMADFSKQQISEYQALGDVA